MSAVCREAKAERCEKRARIVKGFQGKVNFRHTSVSHDKSFFTASGSINPITSTSSTCQPASSVHPDISQLQAQTRLRYSDLLVQLMKALSPSTYSVEFVHKYACSFVVLGSALKNISSSILTARPDTDHTKVDSLIPSRELVPKDEQWVLSVVEVWQNRNTPPPDIADCVAEESSLPETVDVTNWNSTKLSNLTDHLIMFYLQHVATQKFAFIGVLRRQVIRRLEVFSDAASPLWTLAFTESGHLTSQSGYRIYYMTHLLLIMNNYGQNRISMTARKPVLLHWLAQLTTSQFRMVPNTEFLFEILFCLLCCENVTCLPKEVWSTLDSILQLPTNADELVAYKKQRFVDESYTRYHVYAVAALTLSAALQFLSEQT